MSATKHEEDIANSNKDAESNIIASSAIEISLIKELEQSEPSDTSTPDIILNPEKGNDDYTKVIKHGNLSSNNSINIAKHPEVLHMGITNMNMKKIENENQDHTNDIQLKNIVNTSMVGMRNQSASEDQVVVEGQEALQQSQSFDAKDKIKSLSKNIEVIHYNTGNNSLEPENANDAIMENKEDLQGMENNDNCVKSEVALRTIEENKILEECNDSLDEEMELRWDDDDIDDQVSSSDEVINNFRVDNDTSGDKDIKLKTVDIEDLNIGTAIDKDQKPYNDVTVKEISTVVVAEISGANLDIGSASQKNTSDCISTTNSKEYDTKKNNILENEQYQTSFKSKLPINLENNEGYAEMIVETEIKKIEDHNRQITNVNTKIEKPLHKKANEELMHLDDSNAKIEESAISVKTATEDNYNKNKAQSCPTELDANAKQHICFSHLFETDLKSKSNLGESEKDLESLNQSLTESILPGQEESQLIIPDFFNKNEGSLQDSSIDTSVGHIRMDHGLNKPDVMLEIPTQELINLNDMEDMSASIDEPDIEQKEVSYSNIKEIAVHDHLTEKDSSKMISDIKMTNAPISSQEQSQNAQDSKNISQNKQIKEAMLNTNTEDETLTENQEAQIELKGKSTTQYENVTKTLELTGIGNKLAIITSTEINEPAHTTVQKESSNAFETTKEVETQGKKVQPSTSSEFMTPDTSDELPEVTDSLGLLAESSRVIEDDEEQDDEDDGDDDDDFDQDDESSNQMAAEHSEDSNAPQFETEILKEKEHKETNSSDEIDRKFQRDKCNVNEIAAVKEELEKVNDMDVDKIECEEVDILPETVDVRIVQTEVPLIDASSNSEIKAEEKEFMPQQMDTDIETVKLSDTSDNEVDGEVSDKNKDYRILKNLIQEEDSVEPGDRKQSPSKAKKLEIAQQKNVVNIVDLEESSDDEIQEVDKESEPRSETQFTNINLDDVTSVNIPNEIEIMCTSGTGGNTSEIVTKEGEVVISGVPKPPPHKPARLNTSEVTIKTASTHSESTLVIPETMIEDQSQKKGTQEKPKIGLEIFSLDSDDEIEDTSCNDKEAALQSPKKLTALEIEKAREASKCINFACSSEGKVAYYTADKVTIAYYDAARKRKAMVCEKCAEVVTKRAEGLKNGIKNFTPLLDLEMGKPSQELVEISDSESEDEGDSPEVTKEPIGEKGAKLLEENLAALINETWLKYKMDARLKDTQDILLKELEKMDKESKEIDQMLNECQIATDKIRTDLYATFEHERQEIPAIILFDTPNCVYSGVEEDSAGVIDPKRRLSSGFDTPSKKPAIPLGYMPLDSEPVTQPAEERKPDAPSTDPAKVEDDKDIAVVKLSAESAPADLPPSGEIIRPPLKVGMTVYAMRNAFGTWLKGKILEIQPKGSGAANQFTMCRVKFEHKVKNPCKVLSARCIAYAEPADVRMPIGTRVIALFKDSINTGRRESYYSGVVAENPNPVNNYRYLIFFDDGYAQYVQHVHTRLVCECSPLVWEEVHPFIREFVRQYLLAYPERPMVRLHAGQSLKTEWNGKWWVSKVLKVDASLAHVHFSEDNRTEWIYRGSTRLAPLYLELQAAERHRARPLPRTKAQRDTVTNMPYVEYTRLDEQSGNKTTEAQAQQLQNEEIRRQRSVAKKSTATSQAAPAPAQTPGTQDGVTSRVVYYTPKNAVKPYKMTPHTCGPKCKRSDVLSLKELRTYNPLAKPLLSGWERQIVRYKGHKQVVYRAPCGRRARDMPELHRYLRALKSEMPVDLFDFHPNTHCLAEFVLNKCLVGKKDLSHGKENVPVPCVNYYDDSLPEFCSYNTERTPTAGVPLNLDPDFLCGCDCTDDCEDKSKCACWKMTLEGARTIGIEGPNIGYVYKRLPEPLPSGIYECNSRCKCKQTCLNRVAQHPLQLKLQVFKTLNRGWGIRALNDIPKGSFLCVYAGNLLTDATANLDGLNEGDEYLAELDYIEVVEQMKEGYEDDIPDSDKNLDKKENDTEEETDEASSDEEDNNSKNDKEDDDFRPGFIGHGVMEFSKRLRKRDKAKKEKENEATKEKEKEKDSQKKGADEECITISDDEEVREPSRFTAQAGMGANQFVSKYRSVRSHFGKDEACYIMDAKVQGNIGRYLNHSCCPNVFVQNVFVDTHDPRFPWVAFFALSHVRAGTELTWNYNYDVGSVPGKVMYCLCGAPNCRGRLL